MPGMNDVKTAIGKDDSLPLSVFLLPISSGDDLICEHDMN
jgi:hypothetical protein